MSMHLIKKHTSMNERFSIPKRSHGLFYIFKIENSFSKVGNLR